MDAFIWDSIPDTTNPEEAMHWKLYTALGQNHSIVPGIVALYSIGLYFDEQFVTVQGTSFTMCLSVAIYP